MSCLTNFFQNLNLLFFKQFGFDIGDVSLGKLAFYLHMPRDSSSLAITRILFGLSMLFDIPDERGGAVMDKRWGDQHLCHFPLLPFLQPLPMPYMAVVYACLWLGALGIMLGYKYRISAITFTLCYWYIFLIEKSFWNNHSYLFGIVAFLLAWTDAGCFWSIDTYLNPSLVSSTIPYWNYFILKYQFFILYFVAGLKKGTAEWLTGYSLPNLSEHWVFDPFKLFLTVAQIDYLIVHWFAFIFDLTIAFWMMWSRTRNIAMCFCAAFHLMNIRLFRIGMFPWVCLATMPLFYPFDWPKVMIKQYKEFTTYISKCCHFNTRKACQYVEDNIEATENDGYEKFSNEKTAECSEDHTNDNNGESKEVNSNGNELNENCETASENDGYEKFSNEKTAECSEDHTNDNNGESKEVNPNGNELNENCETASASDDTLKTTDGETTLKKKSPMIREKLTTLMIMFFVVLELFLPYSHFITKGYNNWTNGLYGYSWDMMVHTWETQSIVIKIVDNDSGKDFYLDPFLWTPNDRWTRHGDMLVQYAHCIEDNLKQERFKMDGIKMKNISIYADIWFSMNNRFLQRMFNPEVDLLKADWSPFKNIPWLMPLLNEDWRKNMDEIRNDLHAWGNQSDVIFVADFPGYYYENYMPLELTNITLTILKGVVIYETGVIRHMEGKSHILTTGDQIAVEPGFHRVINIEDTETNYMYTFVNVTSPSNGVSDSLPKLPFVAEVSKRFKNMFRFFWITAKSLWSVLFHCPFWPFSENILF